MRGLPRTADPARGRPRGERGRDRRAGRRQRRRQDDHPARLLRRDPTDDGADPLRRPAGRRRADRRARGPRAGARPRGPRIVRAAHHRGEPPDGRLDAAQATGDRVAVRGVRPLPHPQGAPPAERRDPQWRPAADADHRPRAHGPAAPAHARRAVHRAVPEADVGGPRGDRGHPRPRCRRAARRAERRAGAADVRPRLRHGERHRRPLRHRVPSSPRTTGYAPHTWGCRP